MVIINVIVINGKNHKAIIIIIVTVKTNTYLHVIYSL